MSANSKIYQAVQIAREMGIHKPVVIAAQVNALAAATDSASFKERLARNFERTWLYTFIADKSFGITTGRHMGVSWREIPPSASEWWRKPMTAPTDRILSGIVEMRGILVRIQASSFVFYCKLTRMQLNALAQRRRGDNKTLASIFEWHAHYFALLEQTRNERCTSDGLPSAKSLPVLAFYIDHGIMMLNAEALRDLLACDECATSVELTAVSKMSVDVASRLLDLMLTDDTMRELLIGFHNNQYIMICHAATEILHVRTFSNLPLLFHPNYAHFAN